MKYSETFRETKNGCHGGRRPWPTVRGPMIPATSRGDRRNGVCEGARRASSYSPHLPALFSVNRLSSRIYGFRCSCRSAGNFSSCVFCSATLRLHHGHSAGHLRLRFERNAEVPVFLCAHPFWSSSGRRVGRQDRWQCRRKESGRQHDARRTRRPCEVRRRLPPPPRKAKKKRRTIAAASRLSIQRNSSHEEAPLRSLK